VLVRRAAVVGVSVALSDRRDVQLAWLTVLNTLVLLAHQIFW
jgi:hypothetical protein